MKKKIFFALVQMCFLMNGMEQRALTPADELAETKASQLRCRRMINELAAQIAAATNRAQQAEQQANEAERQVNRLHNQTALSEERQRRIDQDFQRANQELQGLRAQLEEARRQIAQLIIERDNIRQNQQATVERIARLEREVRDAQAQARQASADAATAQEQLNKPKEGSGYGLPALFAAALFGGAVGYTLATKDDAEEVEEEPFQVPPLIFPKSRRNNK